MNLLRSLWLHRVAVSIAVLFLVVAGMLAAMYYTYNLPQFTLDQQQTLVYGASKFSPENPSALRVVVRDQTSGKPLANADVAVRLAPKAGGSSQTLYTGKTDTRGTAPIAFTIPANATRDSNLIVETSSPAGRDHIEKPVTIARNYKILVTTDKPLYQPAQTIHLRALALGALDRAPAKEQSLEFLIEDPKGNKIYRKSITTSAYGIASADFVLAETVNAGAYKITATIADTKSEKSVTVKPYVLPKFKVSAETEKNFYLPGERVTGRIRADYFFGKPVAKSDVTLKGIVSDIARAETINLNGKTDADGVYAFAFTLPNYFAASGLNKNRADFGLEVSVTDQANHTEQTSLSLPISSDAIIIDATPESGKLVPGVENMVYILTSLPDGSPLEADLTIANYGNARTGKYGLAEIRVTPQRGNTNLTITARDAQGRTTTRTITLQSETTTTQILLRADRATYRVGETMRLDALTSGGVGTVYLDIIKEGQTLSTRAVDAVNGRATIDVDVTAELIGTTQLHAYHVERDGTITRDTRVVVVEQPSDLKIAVKSDREVYRPGETSKVNFSVTDSAGKGVQSALGVSAVDESVFALAEQDPGFAKLYFLLQKELLEPKYQVKGFELPEVVSSAQPPEPQVRAAQDQSARAAWSSAPVSDFGLRVNSQPEKRAATDRAQRDGFNSLANWLTLILTVIPIGFGALVMRMLHLKGILGKSLAWWMAGMMIYCVASPMFIGAIGVVSGLLIQARVGVIVTAAIALAWLVGFGILVGYAIVKRDGHLQIVMALLAAYFVLITMLWFLASKANALNEGLAIIAILLYLAGLGAIILLGIGLLVQKAYTPGLAAILLAALFIPLTILLAVMPYAGPMLRVMGNPGLYIPPGYLMGCSAAPSGSQSGNLFRDLAGGLNAEQRAPVFSAVSPAPTAAPAAKAGEAPATTGQEPPRLRQFFPETLYFNPQIITDEKGNAALDIELADSITTWRLAVTASSQRGELGASQLGLRVFQDFFVDLDLPVALTQNDEISIPVAVYNYLPSAQKVRLQIEKQPWFTLQDDAEKTITIASNDIDVVYFRIKAVNFGSQKLKVTALGEKMSDAIQREIRVYPDGKPIEVTKSNWLKGDTEHVVEIPAPAIPGASRIEVKIYPGIMSQVVNGLDNILRMPFG
ncbi:hypothetical protein ANRL1_01850 [Anaerolineae bacterium]|nr:hypothetical protein ANRL1_01850 [Anaerolineae bacterium]